MPSKVLEMLAYWSVGNWFWIFAFLNRIPIHRNTKASFILHYVRMSIVQCSLSIVWYQQSWENGLLTVLSKLYFKIYQDAHCLLSIVWYEQSSENGLLNSAHAAWWADAVKDEPSPTSGHPVLLDQPRYTHKQIGYLFKGIVQRDGSG